MNVSTDEAIKAYNSLPAPIRFPSLDPLYVLADAKRDEQITPIFFLYSEGSDLYYHGFHLQKVPGTELTDVQSPYGYGGPVSTSLSPAFLRKAWDSYLAWCQRENVLAEFIRFHPVLGNERFYYGKSVNDRDTVVMYLDRHDLFESYSVRARTAVRKAVKNGVKVEWVPCDEFLNYFPNLYRETMKQLQADDFYLFTDAYFRDLVSIPGCRLAIARYESEVIGGAIFLVSEYAMEYHLSAANLQGKKLNATNLILHEAAFLGREMECKVLHLGGGTDNNSDNPLLFFKSGFSKETSLFKIGFHVLQPQIYEKMKQDWLAEQETVNPRILFYRF
ncbi:MAG: aminoacyltransferase [Bacteroidales bacterium]|nr:aminoacyltransferase [Bacteroidales bacterium]